MNMDPLELLLEKFRAGDRAAVAQLFAEFEELLQRRARRLLSPFLRTQLDSRDMVQSVWAHVLQASGQADWAFMNREAFRAFLLKILQRRVVDHSRRMRASQRRELLTEPEQARRQASQARPSECAEAEELWARMRALCLPQHVPILQLKQEGFSVEEIAAQTNLHPSSVRRILYELARKLALGPSGPSA
jgi:RNA polymerase sigma factor (sigma-70 family)